VADVQIKISARHGHLNEATQQFIHEKASKLLQLFDRLTMIEVTVDLHKDKIHKHVEFKVQAEHKHDIVATAQAEDILGAVDMVMNKLVTQLRRYKEMIQDHRRDRPTGEIAGAPATEEVGEE
jgi:ribosome hibernation promoting factor